MSQERPAHCMVDMYHYERVYPMTWTGTWVVATDGAKIVLANRPTLGDLPQP